MKKIEKLTGKILVNFLLVLFVFISGCAEPTLHSAAERGNIDQLQELFQEDPEAINQLVDGETPLHRAVKNDHLEVVEFLLKMGANPEKTDASGWFPLHHAAYLGHGPIAIKLLEAGVELDLPTEDASKFTPLGLALINRQPQVARIFWQQGAEPAWESGRYTPLQIAARQGYSSLVEKFIEAGVDPDASGQKGSTPIFKAVEAGELRVVGILLEAGAEIETLSPTGETILHRAARAGSSQLIELFLQEGISAEQVDDKGRLPLHYAARSGTVTGLEKLLNTVGISLNTGDNYGLTPLHHAVIGGRSGMVEFLLNQDVVVNLEDGSGKTALHHAVQSPANLSLVELLLGAGANTNVTDDGGNTPLHHLAKNSGSAVMTRRLLNFEAELDETNDTGKTAIYYAIMTENLSLVNQLLESRASAEIEPDSDMNFLLRRSGDQLFLEAARQGHSKALELLFKLLDSPDKDAALLNAAESGDLRSLEQLLEWGADIEVKDRRGRTARVIALRTGHTEAANFLAERESEEGKEEEE